MMKLTEHIEDSVLSETQKTAPQKKVKKQPVSDRLEMTHYTEGGITYHIPVGKKWVRSTFDSFYMTAGGMFIHTGNEANTLYEMEAMFPGHDPSRVSIKCCIPADHYHLSQSYHKNPDCLMALYKKDVSEPIWLGRPELSGNLSVTLPYERYSYGEYFFLITNLSPSAACAHRFKRMDNCWRYDFEFMPNGINLEHPGISAIQIEKDNCIKLSLTALDSSVPCRITAQFFDSELHFIGASQDVRPNESNVQLKVPQTSILTDGTYYAIILHNLYCYQLITLTCKNGHLSLNDCQTLKEDSIFYRLSVDVTCDDTILTQWNQLYGCGTLKKNLLQFTATHDMDDYQHFAFSAPVGFVTDPKVLAILLYGVDYYKEYDVSDMVENHETVSFEDIFERRLNGSEPLVLGVRHIGSLFNQTGMRFLKELEACAQRAHTSLIFSGTTTEIQQLFAHSEILSSSVDKVNRWEVQVPTLDEYIRMAEQCLHTYLFNLSAEAAQLLCTKFNEHRDRIIGMKPHELANYIKQTVMLPCLQRTGNRITSEPKVKQTVLPEDIQI